MEVSKMTNLTIRHPRQGFARDLDRFFDGFFAPVWREQQTEDYSPRVNISESKDDVSLVFELPGMEKDDIKITVADNVLTVAGKREFKSEQKEADFVRTEIRQGSFSRSFTLPDTVNAEKISADYKAGMLTVSMAKREEVKPRQIEVSVK
ncbi:Hsp20 family protein [candidate division GN15 bacterium]|nr:Hsp20 family protein [candidate division GN15 bacterium]